MAVVGDGAGVAVGVQDRLGDAVVGAAQIVLALGDHGHQRSEDEGDEGGGDGGVRLERVAECVEVHGDGEAGGGDEGHHAHGVDGVEHAAAELGLERGELQQVLVDADVGGDGDDPGDGAVRVEAQDAVEEAEHVGLHQHEREGQVDQDEDHPARVVSGDPGEGVRPGQGAGVGVRHVDLDLADHDQGHGQRDDDPGRHHRVEGVLELLDRLGCGGGTELGEDVDREEHADGLLERAQHHPAGPGHDHGRPPGALVRLGLGRHEAQIVDLLADLRDQREAHARAEQHGRGVYTALTVGAGVGEEAVDGAGIGGDEIDQRADHQQQPDRRRPHLELAQRLHAVDHQRDHHERGDQVAEPERQSEADLEALGHDRAFECEEDEGEAGEDDTGEDRTEVAEAGTAGDEVQVDVVAGPVVGQREAGHEDDDGRDGDREQRVAGAVGQADAGADGEVGHVGDAAERGRRHHHRGPAAVTARSEAEGVVLQSLLDRLVGGWCRVCRCRP